MRVAPVVVWLTTMLISQIASIRFIRWLKGERGLGFDQVGIAKLGALFALWILIFLVAWQFLTATTPELRR